MLDAGNAYNALCLMLLVGQQTLLRLIFLRFKSPFLSMRGSCGQWASLLEGVSDVQPCLVSCCLVPLVIDYIIQYNDGITVNICLEVIINMHWTGYPWCGMLQFFSITVLYWA